LEQFDALEEFYTESIGSEEWVSVKEI
jgi:hypothetical protein